MMTKTRDSTHAVRFTDFVLSGNKRPVFIDSILKLDVVIQKQLLNIKNTSN